MNIFKLQLLLLGLSIIVFTSCEQPLGEEEFPYEIKLVIRGVVKDNQIIDSIFIGRTLPVSVPFNQDFAKLSNAVGAVFFNGKFYPLRHRGNGYYTTDSLRAFAGNTYSLVVSWENISANSQTTVPLIGSINGAYVNHGQNNSSTYSFLECAITPFTNEVYGATWFLMNYSGYITNESAKFAGIVKSTSNGAGVLVTTVEIPQSYIIANGSYGIRLYAYDPAYYDYFISSGSSQIPDAIFGQPGTNIKWNIYGDGIGMFIGRADTTIVIGTN